MKIVQIGGALNGAQKIIEEAIHHRAMEMGHESYIFYARGKSDESGIIKYENKIENIVTRALRKYVGKKSCYSAPQTRRLIRNIKSIHPDVIHLHVLHHGYTDYEMLFKYLVKAQIPVVYTMHDMWAFTGGCYHYTQRKCDCYLNGCLNCPADKKDLDIVPESVSHSYLVKRQCMEKLRRLCFVTVSDWVRQEMKRSFLAGYPIEVIPNGIELDQRVFVHFSPVEVSKEKKMLLSVAASWTERKGISMLFELANKLGTDYQINLIGSASDEIMKKAPTNVSFLGYCSDRSELFGYYRQSDLYISTSQEETFGMTFVEAALQGTRSIGYAGTAIGETLQRIYGKAVNEYSAEAFADAVCEVMAQPNCRLTDEQIDNVRKSCSTTRMAEDYMALYYRMIKE